MFIKTVNRVCLACYFYLPGRCLTDQGILHYSIPIANRYSERSPAKGAQNAKMFTKTSNWVCFGSYFSVILHHFYFTGTYY
jgi:hypothetical protein